MKHFYLIWNPYKAGTKEMAGIIETYLTARGCVCAVRGGETGISLAHTLPSQVPENTECVITLGGDGTLIRAARDLCGRQIPLIGVNMGNLGYLTQVGYQEDGEVTRMLDDLIAGQFQLEKRMMLHGAVYRRLSLASPEPMDSIPSISFSIRERILCLSSLSVLRITRWARML